MSRPRNTKQKEDPDQEGKQSLVNPDDFGEILSTEATPNESEQSGAAKEENAGNDDGAGNDEGSDGQDAAVADGTSGTAIVSYDKDRPVEVASSAGTDGDSGNDGAGEEDETSGAVLQVDDDDDGVSEDQDSDGDGDDTQAREEDEGNDNDINDDDDIITEEADDAADTDAKSDDEKDNDVDDDDDIETEAEDDDDTSAEATEGEKEENQNASDAVSEKKEIEAPAEAPDKATKPYADVLRGPHKKSNEELDKLRGSHNRDKSTGALPADDEKAEDASAKERAKGSPNFDSEQHKIFGPPASSSPKGQQHHSSFPTRCSMLSLPCHGKAAFSAHPVSFVLVSATFVLLIIRRIRHRSRNNANARLDGRGEYAAIELLEGNFDDEMSFTGDIDDEDADDIINSWRGDVGNSYIASGVGDDLDDVADGELSLSELNG